jgi:serine/threonine protein kinase/class 3 adenylate cyclase
MLDGRGTSWNQGITMTSQPGDKPSHPSPEVGGTEKQVPGPSDLTDAAGSFTAVPPLLPASGPRTLPETLGRYKILRSLGVGGMAAVYLARDTDLDRLVALKVPHFDPRYGPQLLERFAREARAAANLQHPNICPVHDVGKIDGIPYLTMGYVDGQPLSQMVGPGRTWPQREAAELTLTIALALEEAHGKGVIHRDLKPSNIMINHRGEPIIMDFGLARRLDRQDQRLTEVGMMMGTPAYMPPEQVTGDVESMGAVSDVYSLGVILYELLTGQVPFQGSTASVLTQILNQEPIPPRQRRPDVDPILDAICLKAMAKSVALRFGRMTELADALRKYASVQETIIAPGIRSDRAPNPPDQADAEVRIEDDMATAALGLFRKWGWSMGLRKLKIKVQGFRERHKRNSWQLLLDWVAGEIEVPDELLLRHRSESWYGLLAGWSQAGQAQRALRDRDYSRGHAVLDQADADCDQAEIILRATLAHIRATILSHEGKTSLALQQLHEALSLFGRDHFVTGRVLDTLGMVYAGRGNFRMAREFYEQAIRHKEQQEDDPGLALSHGQLGRLYLDWGQLDEAEEHFQIDLRLAEKLLDQRGEAQMYNHLGQVALARAEREAAAGKKSTARRHCAESAGWLDGSIRLSQECQNPITEAFAHKDRALVHLIEGNLAAAEEQAALAESQFRAAGFHEGTAMVNRVWGVLRRAQERYEDAIRKLRTALGHFEGAEEKAEAALTLWELARTQRDAKFGRTGGSGPPPTPAPLVTRAFLEALARAEQCRRGHLVEAIEAELREVDHEAYYRHLYRRVRGQGDWEETAHLGTGVSEVATVLFLDLKGLTESARGQDPEVVLLTFNQMLAELEDLLERHRAQVLTYLGDGFLAILRQGRHAERAVLAALDLMKAVREFNRPRQILGQPLLQASIGVNTGSVFLGNVGTYRKMNFTAVGPAVSLASRLLNYAQAGWPCISRSTRELLPDHFVYQSAQPRTLTPPGLDPCEVWDVLDVSNV